MNARTQTIIVLGALIGPPGLRAQTERPTPRLVVQATVGHYALSGADFDGTDDAFGLQLSARYRLWRGLALGAGVHRSDHNLPLPSPLRVLAVFAEPRLEIGPRRALVRAVVGARVAYLKRSYQELYTEGNGSGVLAGVLVRMRGGVLSQAAWSQTHVSLKSFFQRPRDKGTVTALELGIGCPVPFAGR